MKPGKHEPSVDRIILTSSAVSVVLGVAIAQLFEFDSHGRLHIASIMGHGVIIDALLILLFLLIVVFILGLTSSVRPGHLIVAGSSIIAAAIGGRAFLLSSSGPEMELQERRTFLIFAGVVIIGGCSVGSGLQRIVTNRRANLSTPKNDEKKD